MASKLKLPFLPKGKKQQPERKPEPHYLVEDKDGWLYGVSESQLKNKQNKAASSDKVKERMTEEILKDLLGE